MTDNQIALAHGLATNVAFRDLISDVIEEEIVKLCSDMRGAVNSGNQLKAAICEGQIQGLEKFWGLLAETAAKYKPPLA